MLSLMKSRYIISQHIFVFLNVYLFFYIVISNRLKRTECVRWLDKDASAENSKKNQDNKRYKQKKTKTKATILNSTQIFRLWISLIEKQLYTHTHTHTFKQVSLQLKKKHIVFINYNVWQKDLLMLYFHHVVWDSLVID